MSWMVGLMMLTAAAVPPTQMPAPWREAQEFVALFAPGDGRAAFYRAYVAAADLDTVLRLVTADPALRGAPGAWTPELASPLDIFGQAGRYDRSRVARLYGGRRPRVARGTRLTTDGTTEAWTLISPYPEPGLRRLESGTLVLVFRRAA